MNNLTALIKLDLAALRHWFAKDSWSKIVILVLYLLLVTSVFSGIYIWSLTFFRYLSDFANYGQFTAQYIIKGTFLLLFWVGVASSTVSTMLTYSKIDKSLDFLQLSPIPIYLLPIKGSISRLLNSFFLYFVTIFPLTLSFWASGFTSSEWGLVNIILTLIFLDLISESSGSILGVIFAYVSWPKVRRLSGLLVVLLLVFFTLIVLRIIFPPELKLLSSVSPENFNNLVSSLPLNSGFLYWNNLFYLSLDHLASLLILAALSVTFFVVSLLVQVNLFTRCRQLANEQPVDTESLSQSPRIFPVSIYSKDLYYLLRGRKEMAYLLFLLTMIVAFFGLLTYSYISRPVSERFFGYIVSICFSWLIFFSGTYLLRFVYPLFINENKSAWWYFTQPVSILGRIIQKAFAAMVISIPLFLVTLLVWQTAPFAQNQLLLIYISIFSILCLAMNLLLVGSHNHDAESTYSEDKASSSATGILSLSIVVTWGLVGGIGMLQSLQGQLQTQAFIAYLTLAGFVVSSINVYVTWRKLSRFSLN